MKHIELMKPADRDDLEKSAALLVEGKRLRQRVLTRLRGRAWRALRNGAGL